MRRSHVRSDASATLFLGALACQGLAVVMFGLDVAACLQLRSLAPSWTDPLSLAAWPRAAHIGWWLAAAVVALSSRVLLHEAGFRQRPAVVGLWVTPFIVLAAGVLAGARWATWA